MEEALDTTWFLSPERNRADSELMSEIPPFGGLRQKTCQEFEDSLGYIVSFRPA